METRMKSALEHAREERPAAYQRRGTTPNTSDAGGPAVSLWLLAVLIAESEFLLSILERADAG